MRLLRALVPLGVAVALALTAFAIPAAAQPATLPTWQVGQEVAYGVNVPLGQEASSIIQGIQANPGQVNITHLNYINFTGTLDSWVDQQVTQATSAYYVLHTVSASGIKLHFVINASFNNLPKAGTFSGTPTAYGCIPPMVPLTTATINVSLDMAMLTTSDGTTNYQVSNLAIMNDTTSTSVQAKATAFLFNVPAETTNQTTCVTTVVYKTESLSLTVDTTNVIRTLFSPALDVFRFPIWNGKTWWANSSATFAGTFLGTINVQGLSAQDEQAFFENLTQAFHSVPGLVVTGLDHFPIDLSQISAVAGGVNIFDHGTLHDTPPYPVSLYLQARESNMSLADNQFHEIFYIYQPTGPSGGCLASPAAVYSPTYPAPGQGMIVGYSIITCAGSTILPVFELHNTPPSTAKDNIHNTRNNYQVFAPPQGNPVVDFFAQAPYWGIILIVAVALVVAFLVTRRRRRPVPGMPPTTQTPPPPPAPPPSGP